MSSFNAEISALNVVAWSAIWSWICRRSYAAAGAHLQKTNPFLHSCWSCLRASLSLLILRRNCLSVWGGTLPLLGKDDLAQNPQKKTLRQFGSIGIWSRWGNMILTSSSSSVSIPSSIRAVLTREAWPERLWIGGLWSVPCLVFKSLFLA